MIFEPPSLDWFKHPNVTEVFQARAKVLAEIEAQNDPEILIGIKSYYRDHIAEFISDWGCTYEPRNVEIGLPAMLPFVMFPRQVECVNWIIDRWKGQEPGIIEKSREVGLSWITVGMGCALCLFNRGMSIGFGSYLKDYVDLTGDFKAIFVKARFFMDALPAIFQDGWDSDNDAPYMRMFFRQSESQWGGQVGDDIGRGDRKGIYFIDEAAHLEHPQLVDAALSNTTNCRIDLSSVNGRANSFAERRHSGNIPVFTFHWRAQPLDAKIVTPTGLRSMRDIVKGDLVIDADGKPTKVLRVSPQGTKDIFRVLFNDGTWTECCDDHLWDVVPYQNQRANRNHIRKVLPLHVIRQDYVGIDRRGFRSHRYQIPLTAPVEFSPQAVLPIDSYVMGCLLGDGSFAKQSFKPIIISVDAPDRKIIDLIDARLPDDCTVKRVDGIQYRIAAGHSQRGGALGRGWHNPVNRAIRQLGLSGTESHTKFIPDIYKFASKADRLALLQGLLDTDGHVPHNNPGAALYSSVSRRLAYDTAFLAQSLGGTAVVRETGSVGTMAIFPGGRKSVRRERYLVEVRLPLGIIPFKLPRKASAYAPAKKYKPRRSIVGIELVGRKKCQCIAVASPKGLYLTDNFIVTHNSDPRKDDAWYAKKCRELSPVVVAQEIDINYDASTEGKLIESEWIQAAIGANEKLGFEPRGLSAAGLDVADEGRDSNAFAGAHGVHLNFLEEWSGKGSDIYATTARAFQLCDQHKHKSLRYDADGLGAGVRGDARVINESREPTARITIEPFRGSGEVFEPTKKVPAAGDDKKTLDRTNKDYFANAKAQAWWSLRSRFQATYMAVTGQRKIDRDSIISIDKNLPLLNKLIVELPRPTYSLNAAGRILVDKQPENTASPNLADAVMIRFAPMRRGIVVSSRALAWAAGRNIIGVPH